MKRSDLTEKLLDIKREKGWSWKHICEKIGGYSEVLIVGAIMGQMKLTKPQAANAAELFGLSKSETAMLNEVPMRGTGTPMPPTDPLIYRFYEAATCRSMGSRRGEIFHMVVPRPRWPQSRSIVSRCSLTRRHSQRLFSSS